MTATRLVVVLATWTWIAGSVATSAQERRPASPAGSSATQVGGVYDPRTGYVGGQWIEVLYGRPVKRGRDIFGPDDYREFLNDGAEIWRAGANVTTRLVTAAPLVFYGTRIAPGAYTVFLDLRVHAGAGGTPHAHVGRGAASIPRPVVLAVSECRQRRWHTGTVLGHDTGVGVVHARPLTALKTPGSG